MRAPADGYTLLWTGSPNAISATLYEKLNFDFIRDIAPVASIARLPLVMEVHPSIPAQTIPEFIAYAKANPGKLNMASGGNGTVTHVAGELFKMMTGVNIVHVPYRGGPPALTDLIAGQGSAPHCFPRYADRIGVIARSASRHPRRGSYWEAPGAALRGRAYVQ